MNILLDTGIIIEFLRKKEKEGTLLVELTKAGHQLYISLLTHTELFAGKSVWEDKHLHHALDKLCSGFHIVQPDTDISKKAGAIRAHYRTDLIDAIIAATAINHELTLATLNTKHFNPIKGLKLL
jgi:tRNA(fMet)-specific endonuclease VapC